ncbi:MAG: hypothetical protein K2L48_03850 [Mycoplasmoidaceae bacterium]|nr:hypothetical protein [Mycoplasmoidaceae bacterium]
MFSSTIQKNNVIKYIITDKFFDKKQIESLRKIAKDNKAFDLIFLSLKDKEITGSIKNIIEHDIIKKIFNDHKLSEGTIFIVADKLAITNQCLGAIRNQLGTMLNLKNPNEFKFC